MTLRITNTSPGNISSLNKWADGIESDIATLKAKVLTVQQKTSNLSTTTSSGVEDLPPNVTSASATMGSATIDGVVYCKVTINYNAPNPLGTFAGVFLVVQNYQGSSKLFKVGENTFTGAAGGADSFVVILNRTNELVTFYLVSKNSQEAAESNWALAPTCTATLNANNVVGSFTITNGNLTSGVKLGGDSGVAANGGSSTLGLGLAAQGGANTLSVLGQTYSAGSSAGFVTADRNLTSPAWLYYANGGYYRMYNSTNGDVEYNNGTQKGFFRTPTSYTNETQGYVSSFGGGAGLVATERTSGNPWYYFADGGYNYLNTGGGTDVLYTTATTHGVLRAPTSFPFETQGQIGSIGSSSAYYFYDRNTPTQSNVLYGAGGYGRMQFNGSDMQYWNGSQAGYYRVPATDTLEYQGTSRAYGSGAGVYTTDRSGSPWYAFYGASGYNRIYRSDLGGDTEQSTASLKGFFRTPGTYTLESAGDIYGTAGGTVKIRINNTALSGRHWSISSL